MKAYIFAIVHYYISLPGLRHVAYYYKNLNDIYT